MILAGKMVSVQKIKFSSNCLFQRETIEPLEKISLEFYSMVKDHLRESLEFKKLSYRIDILHIEYRIRPPVRWRTHFGETLLRFIQI
jgi:hypothetical protein